MHEGVAGNVYCSPGASIPADKLAFHHTPACDEENNTVPETLKRQDCGSGNMELIRRFTSDPAIDAIQTTGDPRNKDTNCEKKARS